MKIVIKRKPHQFSLQKGGERRMRHLKVIFMLGVAGFVLSTLVTSWAAEDVRNTKHNLSANTNIGATGTTEVCVFCHTPHGGDTGVAGGGAPLWNRNMTTIMSNTYSMYTSPNFDSPANDTDTSDRNGKPKGVSLACLSCHDGTLAFDSLLNFPGSGSTDNINFSPTTGPKVNGSGQMINVGSDLFPMLGLDLTNDHPISIEICSNSKVQHDPQFTEACNNAQLPVSGNTKILRISRNGWFPADIRDTIRAYQSAGSSSGWYIECASCHNPHEASRPGTADSGPYADWQNSRFLRKPSVDPTTLSGVVQTDLSNGDRNAGSLLCLSCHQK